MRSIADSALAVLCSTLPSNSVPLSAASRCQRDDCDLLTPRSESFGVAACDFKVGLRFPSPVVALPQFGHFRQHLAGPPARRAAEFSVAMPDQLGVFRLARVLGQGFGSIADVFDLVHTVRLGEGLPCCLVTGHTAAGRGLA